MSSYSSVVLGNSPLAHYRLGESSGTTASDSGGNSYNGVIANSGVTLGISGAIVRDSNAAMTFSDNSGASIALPGEVSVAGNNALTLECWFKPSTFHTNPNLIANTYYGSGSGCLLGVIGANGVYAQVGNGSTYATASNALFAWDASEWYHLAATWDGATIRVYVNGQLDNANTAALSGTVGNSGNAFVIGYDSNFSSDYGTFSLDEVAIYGTALSATQILQHYVTGRNTDISTRLRLGKGLDLSSRLRLGRAQDLASRLRLLTPWFDAGYLCKKRITIDHTKVSGGSDLSNFPVLISLTDADLKTVASGGKVQNSNGYDIILTSDGDIKLDHEIESYTASSGEIVMWVRIPTLSASSDTVIHVYFGNASISSSQENVHGVWDSNYKAVYHLGNGSTLSVADSTSNTNNGTNHGTTADAGQIDGAGNFNGISNYISLPTTGFPSGNNAFSLQCWYKNPSSLVGVNYPVLVEYGHRYGREIVFYFNQPDGHLYLANSTDSLDGGKPSDDVFHHVIGTFDGSALILYIDGVQVVLRSSTGNTLLDQAYIGSDFPDDLYFPGLIDEVRISSIARSAGWIATEYNNQSSPSTFFSAGSLQTLKNQDLFTRLRLGRAQDLASRVRLGRAQDLASRVRLGEAGDLASRVRLGRAQDLASRVRLGRAQDLIGRLRLGRAQDLVSRLRLGRAQDLGSRLRLGSASDLIVRLRLGRAQDLVSRVRLGSARDLIVRLRLARAQDLVSRMRLGKASDLIARLRLGRAQDLASRLRLGSAGDLALRLHLNAIHIFDMASRLRLGRARDLTARLCLDAILAADLSSRLRLGKGRDITCRLFLVPPVFTNANAYGRDGKVSATGH